MRKGKSYKEAGLLGALVTSKIKAEQKLKRIQEYNKTPSICLNCSISMPYDKRHNKFCNSSCSASYCNKGKIKNPNGKNGKKYPSKERVFEQPKKCLYCLRDIKKGATKYCSLKCQANLRWEKTVEKIEADGGFAPNDSYGRAKTMRRYLFEKMGHKCSSCGLEKWLTQPVPLSMDHIDGDPLNNSLSNLRLICCNCDALSSTYKGRNKGKGKGRAYRRQRYSEGKSW